MPQARSLITSTWACISDLESTDYLQPSHAVRSFYVNSTKKMLNRFPFNDTLMKDLSMLQPGKTSSFSVGKVLALARCFPQIGLTDAAALDKLGEEFLDFTISPAGLPSVVEYKAAGGTVKPCTGLFWSKINRSVARNIVALGDMKNMYRNIMWG